MNEVLITQDGVIKKLNGIVKELESENEKLKKEKSELLLTIAAMETYVFHKERQRMKEFVEDYKQEW